MLLIEKVPNVLDYLKNFDLNAAFDEIRVTAKPWSHFKAGGDDRWGVNYNIENNSLKDGYFLLENFIELSSDGWSSSGYTSGYGEICDIQTQEDNFALGLKSEMLARINEKYSYHSHYAVLTEINNLNGDELEALNAILHFYKYHKYLSGSIYLLPMGKFRLCNSIYNSSERIPSMFIKSFFQIIKNKVFQKYLPDFFSAKVAIEIPVCKGCNFIAKAKQEGWRVVVIDQTTTFKHFNYILSKFFNPEGVMDFIANYNFAVPCYLDVNEI